MPPIRSILLTLSILAPLTIGVATAQSPPSGKRPAQHLLDWSEVFKNATALIEVQGADGALLRQSYGSAIGDPPMIVTPLSQLVGGQTVVATFRDGTTVSTTSVRGFDPINDIAVLEFEGYLPRTANPDETMKWRFQENVYVLPGPDMGEEWPMETSTTPYERGKLKVVPISGDHPAGLSVMHDCGRWVGFTGRIEDATGSFCYITTIETVLPVLFAEASPTSIEEAASRRPDFRDGSTADGLITRAVVRGFTDTEGSKPFFDLARKKYPEIPEGPFWYGKILFKEDSFAEAENAFREAFRLRPDWESAYQMAGASANQQGNYSIALGLYDQGLAVAPKSVKLRINKWGALYNLGRLSQAVATLEEALGIDPASDLALYNLGTTYFKMGKRLDAEEVYGKLDAMGSRYARVLRARLDE